MEVRRRALLTGTLQDLTLEELSGSPNVLSGTGLFQITGGDLLPLHFPDSAKAVQVSFGLNTAISDFSSPFTSVTNLTLLPLTPDGRLRGFARCVWPKRPTVRPSRKRNTDVSPSGAPACRRQCGRLFPASKVTLQAWPAVRAASPCLL